MERVVVVGAVNVDMVVAAPRLPGPGETVVGPGMRRFGGGKGANAAVAAARLGAAVRYAGAVGDDDLGRAALAELRAEGIDVDAVAVLAEHPTGVALIVVDAGGENQIAVGAGANGQVVFPPPSGAGLLDGAGSVLVSTEIPPAAVAAAVEAATSAGVRCVLNPAPVLPGLAELLDLGPLLTPNAGELRDLAGAAGVGGGDTTSMARALAARTGAPVVVTLGGDGVLVVDDGEVTTVPALRVPVRDTTGAGDTFNGVLAARLAAGAELRSAVTWAGAAAGLSVQEDGARGGMPTAAAVERALSIKG